MDGIHLEYVVYSHLKKAGVKVERACESLDHNHGTDLIVGDVHVGVTMNGSHSKVLCDFEKARKVTKRYVELYFDVTMVGGEEKLEKAVGQAAEAVEFLSHHKGFFLVTLDGGKRAKIDSSLQSKMAPVRYATAY